MKINEVLLKELETGNIGKPGNVTKPGDAAPAAAPAAPAANNTTSSYTGVPTPAPGQGARKKTTARPDPKVKARQQELIAAGAKIKDDGIPGPKTTQAEKDFGTLANSAKSGGGATTPAADQATAAQTQTSNYAGGDQRTANARDANAAPPAAAPAAAPAAEPAAVAANPGTPAAGVGFNQGAPNPEIARLQQLGGMQAQVANPLQPAPGDAAQAAAAPAAGDAAQAAAAPSALPNPCQHCHQKIKNGLEMLIQLINSFWQDLQVKAGL